MFILWCSSVIFVQISFFGQEDRVLTSSQSEETCRRRKMCFLLNPQTVGNTHVHTPFCFFLREILVACTYEGHMGCVSSMWCSSVIFISFSESVRLGQEDRVLTSSKKWKPAEKKGGVTPPSVVARIAHTSYGTGGVTQRIGFWSRGSPPPPPPTRFELCVYALKFTLKNNMKNTSSFSSL